jgi:hypothetical protein
MPGQIYPDLLQFLGGYFHQDFLCVHATPDAAIDDFLRSGPRELRLSLCKELDLALSDIRAGRDPASLLEEHCCDYDPTPDGWEIADWLRYVRTRIADALQQEDGRSP